MLVCGTRTNDRQNAKRRRKTRNWAGPWRQIPSGVRNARFRFDPRCPTSFIETDAGIEITLQACQNEATDRGRDKNHVWEAVEIVSRLSGHFTRMFMFVNNASAVVSMLCLNVFSSHISIGENIKLLVDRPDGTYCFRLHNDRVYYMRYSSTDTRCGNSPSSINSLIFFLSTVKKFWN